MSALGKKRKRQMRIKGIRSGGGRSRLKSIPHHSFRHGVKSQQMRKNDKRNELLASESFIQHWALHPDGSWKSPVTLTWPITFSLIGSPCSKHKIFLSFCSLEGPQRREQTRAWGQTHLDWTTERGACTGLAWLPRSESRPRRNWKITSSRGWKRTIMCQQIFSKWPCARR